MSLLQYSPPVDYAAQTIAVKDFLNTFKSMQSSSEAAATEALQDLNIDEGRTSDEYDFMDDADEMDGANTRGASRRQSPKLKYMQILQDVANRDKSHLQIDLDDLEIVSIKRTVVDSNCSHFASMKNPGLRETTSSLSNPSKRTHTTMSTSSRKRSTTSCPGQRRISRKS